MISLFINMFSVANSILSLINSVSVVNEVCMSRYGRENAADGLLCCCYTHTHTEA